MTKKKQIITSNKKNLLDKLNELKKLHTDSLPAAKVDSVINNNDFDIQTIEEDGIEVLGTLTTKQLIFCEEYIKDYNGARAARAAGYSEGNAANAATKNLKKSNIQAQIAKNEYYKYKRNEDSIDKIKDNLYRILIEAQNDMEDDNHLIQLKVLDMLAKLNGAYITTTLNLNSDDTQPLFPDVDYDDDEYIDDVDYNE